MAKAVHISEAREMMRGQKVVSLSHWTAKGEIRHYDNCASLRFDTHSGVRNIKIFPSGQIRKVRDICIFRINDLEVYI